jgi:hypothetical protein
MEQRWWYFEVVEWMCVKWVNKGKLMMYIAQVGFLEFKFTWIMVCLAMVFN